MPPIRGHRPRQSSTEVSLRRRELADDFVDIAGVHRKTAGGIFESRPDGVRILLLGARIRCTQPVSCGGEARVWTRRADRQRQLVVGVEAPRLDPLAVLRHHDLGDFGGASAGDHEVRDVRGDQGMMSGNLLTLQLALTHGLNATIRACRRSADRIDRWSRGGNHADFARDPGSRADRLDRGRCRRRFRHFAANSFAMNFEGWVRERGKSGAPRVSRRNVENIGADAFRRAEHLAAGQHLSVARWLAAAEGSTMTLPY